MTAPCICPRSCDCQAPNGGDLKLVSFNCPIHNWDPDPYPECEADEHFQEIDEAAE